MARQNCSPSTATGSIFFLFVLLAPAMAGCIDSDPTESPAPTVGTLPTGFTNECPPGPVEQRTPDICVGTLYDPMGTYLWPLVAVHPHDTETIVLTHNRLPADQVLLPGASPPLRLSSGHILVSTDGGATWDPRELPDPPMPAPTLLADLGGFPVTDITFSATGTLHILITRTAGEDGQFVYHSRSDDLGATWSTPHLFNEEGGVTNAHIATEGETIAVTWTSGTSFSDRNGHLTISHDDGKKWQPSIHLHDDYTTQPVFWNDSIFVLHTAASAVHRIDPMSSEHATYDQLPPGTGNLLQLTASPRAGIVAASLGAWEGNMLIISTSFNGTHWTNPVNIAPQSDHLPHGHWRIWGLAPDQDGLVHYVLHDTGHGHHTESRIIHEGRAYHFLHLVVDPAETKIVYEQRLTPEAWDERRTPPSLGPDIDGGNSDGRTGITIVPDGILLAWTYDKGIDYTLLRPVWSDEGTANS